jgi:hypothetical protein
VEANERKAAKQARKEEKRRRKAEKAQRKVERAKKKAAAVAALAVPTDSRHDVDEEREAESAAVAPARVEAVQAPATVQQPIGRHAVRQRYIRQKRMALTDAKALNEVRPEFEIAILRQYTNDMQILMVKT